MGNGEISIRVISLDDEVDGVVLGEDEVGNGDPKCPLVLLLDTSASMNTAVSGRRVPIDQLNDGLQALEAALRRDRTAQRRVEVLVVPFGGAVVSDGRFELARYWTAPRLTAAGRTPMGAAVRFGIDAALSRRRTIQAEGNASYTPWVFLMTDGAPTDEVADIPELVRHQQGKVMFWCIAAPGADISTLRSFTPDKPVLQFDQDNWPQLFVWISAAVSAVSQSSPGDRIQVPAWQFTT